MISDKIIVVDDDPRIHQSLKEILFEYQLVPFLDPQKALDYLLHPNEIKLAIIDVRMQGLNGIELLEALRRARKDLPIMIITAHGGQDIVVEALRFAADDYVEKPFDINELRERVKAMLKENSIEDPLAHDLQTQVDRIRQFIQQNYTNASLEYIAQEMCLSPQYVGRLFTKYEKGGFRQYRLKIRMEKAMDLLKHSSLDISEIAYQLGYENPESFMRAFKKHVKKSPSAFRDKQQKKKRKTA
jgi:YesN/AraC family two-component response regulator